LAAANKVWKGLQKNLAELTEKLAGAYQKYIDAKIQVFEYQKLVEEAGLDDKPEAKKQDKAAPKAKEEDELDEEEVLLYI